MRQTLPTVNRKHLFMTVLCTKSFCPRKVQTEHCSSVNGRHFDYWNKPLNMHKHVCYLDCREAGLCYYLVVHTENQLHPLQLLYFHLRPIYRLSLVYVQAFLTSALDGVEWSVSYPARFTTEERDLGTHCIGGWLGPKAGLKAAKKSLGVNNGDISLMKITCANQLFFFFSDRVC
jgi:hypothetical protein